MERRQPPARRRMLKSGQILLGKHPVPCTIRNRSGRGAWLKVQTTQANSPCGPLWIAALGTVIVLWSVELRLRRLDRRGAPRCGRDRCFLSRQAGQIYNLNVADPSIAHGGIYAHLVEVGNAASCQSKTPRRLRRLGVSAFNQGRSGALGMSGDRGIRQSNVDVSGAASRTAIALWSSATAHLVYGGFVGPARARPACRTQCLSIAIMAHEDGQLA